VRAEDPALSTLIRQAIGQSATSRRLAEAISPLVSIKIPNDPGIGG
jgi:hypothetical protein